MVGTATVTRRPCATRSVLTCHGCRTLPVPVDGDTLRGVAEQTGGTFHEAATAAELTEVYTDIGSSVGYSTEWREITAWFVGSGLLTAVLVAVTSLAWFARLP